MTRPGRRTWYRRIAAEKKRLREGGVPEIEIHLVTRMLASPRKRAPYDRWLGYLEQCERGVSPWQ